MKEQITKDTKISEIIERYPDTMFILMEYGLMCAACSLANQHGLGETKELYGFTDKEIEEMIKRINETIEKNEAKQ
jgi:hybrid cluster-associated redox disulfide protein